MVEFIKKPEEYGFEDYVKHYVPDDIKEAGKSIGMTEMEQKALSLAMEIEMKHLLYVTNKAESRLGFSREHMKVDTDKHADGNGAIATLTYVGKDTPVFLGSVSHRFKMTPRGEGKDDALTVEISRICFDDEDRPPEKHEKEPGEAE